MITLLESGLHEGDRAKLRCGTLERPELLEDAVSEVAEHLVTDPPVRVFGRACVQHRDICLFAPEGITYSYTGSKAPSASIGPALDALRTYVNAYLGTQYNAVLVNRYKNGNDFISDHSDNERGLDAAAGVVTISYGQTRTFRIKRRADAPIGAATFKNGRMDVELTHNSILVMEGPGFQRSYTHGVPKRASSNGVRYSFTFRRHVPN